MRFVNYNVGDASIHSSQYLAAAAAEVDAERQADGAEFRLLFSCPSGLADAETYQFTTVDLNGNPLPSPQINRDRFYVFHQQNLIGDEGSVSYKGAVFGLPNTAVAGFDYSHLNFDRIRGFPNNDLVDPFNPSPGLFGPLLQPGELCRATAPRTGMTMPPSLRT